MGKLNSTVDEVTRNLLRDVVKSHKKGVIRTWGKRKVIPIAKWEEFRGVIDTEKKIRYIPEDYVEWPWPFSPKDDFEKRQIDEWFRDWMEYLYEKQKPLHGEYLCRRCILHHESGKYNSSIRDLVLKRAGKSVKYPCDIENIFKCPFLPKGPSVKLFDLQKILNLVIDSLRHAESLSMYNKKTVIGYFKNNFAEDWNPFDRKPSAGGSLIPTLEIFHISDVFVDSIQDIYNVLTSDKILTAVIDQHITDIRNPPKSKIKLADQLETIKPKAISYFKSIQKKIRIEDIRDFSGRNLEEEKKDIQRVQEIYKPREGDPLTKDIVRAAVCMQCQGFANIKCANCDKWICTKHWKEHAVNFHGYNFTIQK